MLGVTHVQKNLGFFHNGMHRLAVHELLLGDTSEQQEFLIFIL